MYFGHAQYAQAASGLAGGGCVGALWGLHGIRHGKGGTGFLRVVLRFAVQAQNLHDGQPDVCLYEGRIEGLDDNVHFLKNDGITLEDVKFYGVPFFIAGMEDKAAEVVPDGTDIVISHEPPFGILDDSDFELGGNLGLDSITHYGSTALRERICKVKPKYSIFGHVHSRYGSEQHGDTTFINASIMAPEGRLNSPVLITFQ